ncbi:MAG: hypothetical protein V2J25_04755 [Desulfatiglans sp.]|jgi:hypothetical protein|nr:hypothetical protein [Desulfatiglans sp.]
MKSVRWQILLGLLLLALSVFFYFIHYLIFSDLHHISIFALGDISFVFVEVLLVTLIIHRVLDEREKKIRLEKMNMVIGVFFSEVGTKLLEIISKWDPQIENIQQEWDLEGESSRHKFERISAYLKKHDYDIQSDKPDWEALREFLIDKRDCLMRLLENPNLLEHESFTDALWPTFHLAEELEAHVGIENISEADHKHLCRDTMRVYGTLALQWISYMEHLKANYPYLFSFSLRINPFEKGATPAVD